MGRGGDGEGARGAVSAKAAEEHDGGETGEGDEPPGEGEAAVEGVVEGGGEGAEGGEGERAEDGLRGQRDVRREEGAAEIGAEAVDAEIGLADREFEGAELAEGDGDEEGEDGEPGDESRAEHGDMVGRWVVAREGEGREGLRRTSRKGPGPRWEREPGRGGRNGEAGEEWGRGLVVGLGIVCAAVVGSGGGGGGLAAVGIGDGGRAGSGLLLLIVKSVMAAGEGIFTGEGGAAAGEGGDEGEDREVGLHGELLYRDGTARAVRRSPQ